MRRITLIATCGVALAASAASTFTCTPTNNSILFGTYNPLSTTDTTSTGSFVIACTDVGGKSNQSTTLTYTATLSGQTSRSMAPPNAGPGIGYNIYTNTGRTTVWGDGTGGTSTLTGAITIPGSSTVTTGTLNYYGLIANSQDVSAMAPGPAPTTYTQQLTITVTCKDSKGKVVAC